MFRLRRLRNGIPKRQRPVKISTSRTVRSTAKLITVRRGKSPAIRLVHVSLGQVPHILDTVTRTQRTRAQVISVTVVAPVNSRRTFHVMLNPHRHRIVHIRPNAHVVKRRPTPDPRHKTRRLSATLHNSNLSLTLISLQLMRPIRRHSITKRRVRHTQTFRHSIHPRRQLPAVTNRHFTRVPSRANVRFVTTNFQYILHKSTASRIRHLVTTSVRKLQARRQHMFLGRTQNRVVNLKVNNIRHIVFRTFSRTRQTINIFKRLARPTVLANTRVRMRIPRHNRQQRRFSTTAHTMLIRVHSIINHRQVNTTPHLTRLSRHRNVLSVRLRLVMFVWNRLISGPNRRLRHQRSSTYRIRAMNTRQRYKLILSVRTKSNAQNLPSSLPRHLRAMSRSTFTTTARASTLQFKRVRHMFIVNRP